jgi:hypothetical protein
VNGHDDPPRPLLRALRVATIVALVAALSYQAVGAAVFLPRFGSDDPREVVTAYYDAQRWGYRTIAEQALDPRLRQRYRAPNAVRGLRDDTFLASDLAISGPAGIRLYGEHADEVQFVVVYRSPWSDGVGDPPGRRMWFVYVGRDAGEPWRILSIGTGP